MSIAIAERPVYPLQELRSFRGTGVYALYYRGDHELYRPIVEWNADDFKMPLYVGKGVAEGTRKGAGVTDDPTSTKLAGRLRNHLASIDAVDDLDVSDFSFRYLLTAGVWIPLLESSLIALYQPVWNVVLEGFGNNPTGGPRSRQRRSPWDTVHPLRPRAAKLPENPTPPEVFAEKVRNHIGEAIEKAKSETLAPPAVSSEELQAATGFADEGTVSAADPRDVNEDSA